MNTYMVRMRDGQHIEVEAESQFDCGEIIENVYGMSRRDIVSVEMTYDANLVDRIAA